MTTRVTLFLLLCPLLAVFAAEDSPKGVVAQQARKALDQQLKWADAQFEQAVKAAKLKRDAAASEAIAEYRNKLKAALDAALKAKNVEEVKRIDAELKAVGVDAALPEEPKSARDRLADKLRGTKWRMRGSPRQETMHFVEQASVVINRVKPDQYNEGVWTVLDEDTIRLTRPPLNGQVFDIDANHKVLSSTSKDATFDRID